MFVPFHFPIPYPMGCHIPFSPRTVKLLKLTSKARNDVESLRRNKRIKRHPRYSTVYKQRELVQAWKELYAGDLTAAEFLDKAAFLKGHVRKRLEIIANNPPEDEFEMTESPQTMSTDEDLDFDREIVEGVRFMDEPVAVANDESDSHSPDRLSAVNQESDSDDSVPDRMSDSPDGQESSPDDPPVELENEDDDVPPMDAVRDLEASSQVSERNLMDPINDAEQLNGLNYGFRSDSESDPDDAVPDRMSVISDGQESNSDYGPVEREYEDGDVPPIDVVRGVEAGDGVPDRDDGYLMDLLDDADQMNGPNYGNQADNDDIQEVARVIEIDARGPVLDDAIVIYITDSDSDEVREVERDDGGINNDHPRAKFIVDPSNDGAIAAAATAPESRAGGKIMNIMLYMNEFTKCLSTEAHIICSVSEQKKESPEEKTSADEGFKYTGATTTVRAQATAQEGKNCTSANMCRLPRK